MKRFVKCVFRVLLLVLLVLGFVVFNLKSNSVYYAEYTPHKPGVEPVLMELVDSLFWVSTPGLPGIEYRYDGGKTIYNENCDRGGQTIPWFATFGGGEYSYHDGYISYRFDRDFQLILAMNSNNLDEIDPSSVDVDQVKRDIYRLVQPVVDAQSEPWVNLQWVYDWLNRDRFNQN